jgi:aminomethyltransferase
MNTQLKYTSLHQDHLKSGGKMVPFAGYEMPVEYQGIKTEHLWVREHAGLFDVSHMGQAFITGSDVAGFCMQLTPSAFNNLSPFRAKYTVLTNEAGGIIDDCIITKLTEDRFFIVYNAACKDKDIAWITQHLSETLQFKPLDNHALLALQGPESASVLQAVFPTLDLTNQPYMGLTVASFKNTEIFISRLGYTGEDGFEISIPNTLASNLWNTLLTSPEVKPIGLGARDSLRLEAGYPLYGHDLDSTTSPIEANLSWLVRKKDMQFIGANRIIAEQSAGPSRLRVGITLVDKGIVREGTPITDSHGRPIGRITSGGFGPTLNGAIAQGYVDSKHSTLGTLVYLTLRGRQLTGTVSPLSFIPAKTKSAKRQTTS